MNSSSKTVPTKPVSQARFSAAWSAGARLALPLCLALISGCSQKPVVNPNVLVKVGTREITVADYEREVKWRVDNSRPLPEKQALLDEMILKELRLQKARAAGLDKDQDVQRRYEALLMGKLEDVELRPRLEGIKVSADEIRAAYERDVTHYTRPAKARLALICLKKDRKTSDEKLAEMEQRITDARKAALALPAGTRGFGAVAGDYSEDQVSRYKGGDVGWFDEGRTEFRWPKEVVEAGFALSNVGDISEVIRTTNGFYLVAKIDTRPAELTPLDQVQNPIQRHLLADRRQQVQSAYSQELRGFAPVQTYPLALANLPYPTTTVAKAEETLPPMLPGTTISTHGQTPAN
jgi:parvulin-like peptidyl-prolyl isomerase